MCCGKAKKTSAEENIEEYAEDEYGFYDGEGNRYVWDDENRQGFTCESTGQHFWQDENLPNFFWDEANPKIVLDITDIVASEKAQKQKTAKRKVPKAKKAVPKGKKTAKLVVLEEEFPNEEAEEGEEYYDQEEAGEWETEVQTGNTQLAKKAAKGKMSKILAPGKMSKMLTKKTLVVKKSHSSDRTPSRASSTPQSKRPDKKTVFVSQATTTAQQQNYAAGKTAAVKRVTTTTAQPQNYENIAGPSPVGQTYEHLGVTVMGKNQGTVMVDVNNQNYENIQTVAKKTTFAKAPKINIAKMLDAKNTVFRQQKDGESFFKIAKEKNAKQDVLTVFKLSPKRGKKAGKIGGLSSSTYVHQDYGTLNPKTTVPNPKIPNPK